MVNCVHPQQQKKVIEGKRLQVNYVQSFAGAFWHVSTLDYSSLILVDPGVKINEISHCILLLPQPLQPAIRRLRQVLQKVPQCFVVNIS